MAFVIVVQLPLPTFVRTAASVGRIPSAALMLPLIFWFVVQSPELCA
jgi:hypothetical protein